MAPAVGEGIATVLPRILMHTDDDPAGHNSRFHASFGIGGEGEREYCRP
jgi:hypothetical protein